MATTSWGRAQDRKLVAGGQDHEVQYGSDKTGASKDMVKNRRQGRKQPRKSRSKTEK
ncbi:hypothetical protein D3C71_814340 [compost metagenome]